MDKININSVVASHLLTIINDLKGPYCFKEKRQIYIDNFKKNFDGFTCGLNLEEKYIIKDYMDSLIEYSNNSKESLSNLFDSIYNNAEGISSSSKYSILKELYEMKKLMDLTLEVVNIAMEELIKYLPSEPSDVVIEKKLENIPNNNVSE